MSARAAGALVIACIVAFSSAGHATPTIGIEVRGGEGLPSLSLDSPDFSKASPRPRVVLHEARGTRERALVRTCVALAADGWVAEAEPIAFERLVGLAAATVARARGKGPVWHEAPTPAGPAWPLRRVLLPHEGDDAEASLALGFVGSGGHEAVACFAVSYGGAPAAREARFLAPFGPPPEPGLTLRGLVWAVHHPREVAGGAGGIALTLALLYLWSRPRPRIARRIRSTRGP